MMNIKIYTNNRVAILQHLTFDIAPNFLAVRTFY